MLSVLAQSYPRAGFEEVEPDKRFANFGEATLTGTGMVQGGTSSIWKHRPRRIFPVKSKVFANKDSDANGATEAEALVMAVPQA